LNREIENISFNYGDGEDERLIEIEQL